MAVGRNTRFRKFMTVQDMIPMPVREDERDNLATVLLCDLHRPLVCFGRRVDDYAFLQTRLNQGKSIGAYRWKFLRFDNHINHNDAGAGLGFNAELMSKNFRARFVIVLGYLLGAERIHRVAITLELGTKTATN